MIYDFHSHSSRQQLMILNMRPNFYWIIVTVKNIWTKIAYDFPHPQFKNIAPG